MTWEASAESDRRYSWKNEQERRPMKMEYQRVEESFSASDNLLLLRLHEQHHIPSMRRFDHPFDWFPLHCRRQMMLAPLAGDLPMNDFSVIG